MMNPEKRCHAPSSLRRATSAAALLALALATPVHALDLASTELDTLLDLHVSGASKFALRISESASSATVITSEQMRALGHRTLADALRSVRGLVVSSDRTYSYLGVRGFSAPGDYNTRVLVLIDGNRVNDTVYDQGFLGSEFPLDLDLVERIEFIPGPGSAVHGANALFGTVNVVTRKGGANIGNEVAARVGQGSLRGLRWSGSKDLSADTNLLLSATRTVMAGNDVALPGFGLSSRTDHERGTQLFAKLESGEFTSTLIHGDRIKGLTAYPGTVFGDPRSLFRDTQTLADLSWQHPLEALSRLKLRLYGGSYTFRGDYLIDVPPPTLNRDGAQSRWWGVEGNVFTERFDGHKLVLGGELQLSPRRDQSSADVAPTPATFLDDRRHTRRHAVYGEDQWTPLPAWSFTLGLRYDGAQDSAGQWSPRVAVVHRATSDMVLKFIHGDAYRPPNAYELYYAFDGYKGNPTAQDERVSGNEFVLEVRPTPASRWTLSAYANRMRNLLVQDVDPADGALVFRNVGALHAHGLELEGERLWPSGVQLRGNVSVQQVTDASGGGRVPMHAKRLGKLIAIVPLHAGWTLGSESVMVGRRGDLPGHGVTNLTVSSSAWQGKALLSFTVYDLFDRKPQDPGSDSALQSAQPQDGRSIGAKVALKF